MNERAMESFEIHITGADDSIIEAAKPLGIKTISIDLLRPDCSVLRTEYMTSQKIRLPDFSLCYLEAQRIKKELGISVLRTKIECPPYSYYFKKARYIECHFRTKETNWPTSINRKKDYLLATVREYNREKFTEFCNVWKNELVELCLYDSFVEEDKDWFELYNNDGTSPD